MPEFVVQAAMLALFAVVAAVVVVLFHMTQPKATGEGLERLERWLRRDRASSGGSVRWFRPEWSHGIGRHALRVGRVEQGPGNITTRIEVVPAEAVPVTIRRLGGRDELSRRLGGQDVHIGIPAFDDAFRLQGALPADVITRMGAGTRAAVRVAVGEHHAQVQGGRIVLDLVGGTTQEYELRPHLERLVALADMLVVHPGSNADALHGHALGDPDPDPGFRRLCLKVLLTEYPGSNAAAKAWRELPDCGDVGLRFVGARCEGEAGLATLKELLSGGGLPAELQAEARMLLGSAHAGVLSLEPDAAGGLSLDVREGALSPAESTGE
jgi:hypothetical protein